MIDTHAPAVMETASFPAPSPAGAETGRFKRWVVAVACLVLSLGCGPDDDESHFLQQGDPLASVAEWRKVYKEVPADDPALARAQEVFERVRDASGQHAELVVLKMGEGPIAFALADPAVVLSSASLALCYEDVPPEQGDARLGFVLGHELAHLRNGDFWHASAFATVRGLEDEDEVARDLQALFEEDPQDRKKAELRADDAGALALLMAGHDPVALFEQDRTFFEQWVRAVPGLMAYQDPQHPTPAARARLLQARLADVADRIHLFHEGVEAYRAGDYERAVERFGRFRRWFPGREVLNDLALAHLKLAAAELAGCDGILVTRYYLPEALDDETLAERAVKRGAGERSSPCFDKSEYRTHMKETIELLEDAARQDARYLDARLNLVAAFALDEQGAPAALAGEEAARLAPDDPQTLGARATAYLAHSDLGGTFVAREQVLEELEALHHRFPDEPSIAYNLASALSRDGRAEEAEPVWRDFLRVEPEGAWAELACEWLDEEPCGVEVAQR